MTRGAVLAVLVLGATAASPRAARGADRMPVTVVPVAGSPLAREVAAALEKKGLVVDLAPSGASAPAPALPFDQTRACIAEGRALAFRLEHGAAIASLESCLERHGPALSRPEGAGAMSALLVELGAAAVGAGERDRARSAFLRLARLPNAVEPDPSVQPPVVMKAWEEARRAVEPTRAILVEAVPPWTAIYVAGREVSPGERIPLAQGPHFASADAAGFLPWSGTLLVEGDTTRLPVRLLPLERDARAAAVRARAGTIPPGAAGAAEELTAAFGTAVVMVAGGRGVQTSGVLFVPAERGGRAATVGGRFVPPAGSDPAEVIANGVARKLGGSMRMPKRKTMLWAGGIAAGVLLVGAGAALLDGGGDGSGGDKTGSVVWEPGAPPVPPHGAP